MARLFSLSVQRWRRWWWWEQRWSSLFLSSRLCSVSFSSLLSSHRPFVLSMWLRGILKWYHYHYHSYYYDGCRSRAVRHISLFNREQIAVFSFRSSYAECVHVALFFSLSLSLAVPFILFRNNAFSKTNNNVEEGKKEDDDRKTH